MSQFPSCATCGMPAGNCRHTTEGQVTERPMSRAMAALLGRRGDWPGLSADDVSDEYAAPTGTIGQDETQIPTRPQVADAALRHDPPASTAPAGGAVRRRNNQLYDPKCRELAEYFAAGNEPALTDEQIDDLSQDIQDAVESYLRLVDSEGQS